jgi:2-polyprenyl-6-methoxyphenol hydroxylase-like FAD-dependent oxidoreductase
MGDSTPATRHGPDPTDVLVVGAGPTGLALAAQLAAYGVTPTLIDRAADRVHESRALAIQPRTLEVLAGLGITKHLVAAGNPAVRLRLHTAKRVVSLPLFDFGLHDTAYPYLLFLSQAETERMLEEHLTAAGTTVERGTELTAMEPTGDAVTCRLRHADGTQRTLTARYVVGCDGAHSTVRHLAGIGFEGGSYPQTFVLADTEADSIEADAAHAFLSGRGILFVFPLGHPTTWRLLAMRPRTDPTPPDAPVTLDEVQHLADAYTGGTIRLHDPAWMTNFRLHHRAATRYRAGRVFLAGDAAHIHSPAGAQGMNTGIQDAINLGWKLAHALHGVTDPTLLDSYQIERAPIGRMVLRFTDRAFTAGTSTNPLIRLARTRLIPAVLPLAARAKTARAYAFRTISQLAIHYRGSPLSADSPNPPRHGPKAGDRLPDAALHHNGQDTTLHKIIGTPGWHLLLHASGQAQWEALARLADRWPDQIHVHHLPADDSAQLLRRLGVSDTATTVIAVRPDGHIGYRTRRLDLPTLDTYLSRWLPKRADQGVVP